MIVSEDPIMKKSKIVTSLFTDYNFIYGIIVRKHLVAKFYYLSTVLKYLYFISSDLSSNYLTAIDKDWFDHCYNLRIL